jgi:hypothetical protein
VRQSATTRSSYVRRIKDERIDNTEYRGVRTDTKRQRDRRGKREARLLPHATQRETQVLPETRHRFTSTQKSFSLRSRRKRKPSAASLRSRRKRKASAAKPAQQA